VGVVVDVFGKYPYGIGALGFCGMAVTPTLTRWRKERNEMTMVLVVVMSDSFQPKEDMKMKMKLKGRTDDEMNEDKV
jgi:hypothetical protein